MCGILIAQLTAFLVGKDASLNSMASLGLDYRDASIFHFVEDTETCV